MFKLPAERVVSLLKANGLNCQDEMHLMEFLEKYIKHRDYLPALPEEKKVTDAELRELVSEVER